MNNALTGRDFAELKAFMMIVTHGSFTRAAAYLGITPSTLSTSIRQLETRLQVRLLNRTTRSVSPTSAGERLFQRLRPVFSSMEEAIDELRDTDMRLAGRLRLNVSRVAAVHYLAPLLGEFIEAYPEIMLDVVVDDRLVDIVAERFDAGIRLGEKLHNDMIARRLSGDLLMKVVAAPAYLERHGRPEHPRELVHHRCLTYRNPSDGSVYRWEFERGGERLEVAVSGPIIVDEPAMLSTLACQGSGIGYQFAHQVDEMLADGRLVQLLDEWTPAFPGFYLYYSARQVAAPLRALIDFIAERAGA
ncbi:LysR family transcriptional regulator [Zymobacter palmae]|uniref:Transcriptional regulator n=1 Tax=Zymobacter palmae TaxID=33074 RepID=A0A348HC55_9GAMM|nr:LysR family transcriptional regulator [Zymobacter palmae]BBG29207.1 transcriptional regulator [Zymobacter palmae]